MTSDGRDVVAATVEEALATLPAWIAERIENVAVELGDEEPGEPGVLGLYRGVPLTGRMGSVFVPPDRITIFGQPLERLYGHDPALLREQTIHVVHHELAHHFGISDERLREMDRY